VRFNVLPQDIICDVSRGIVLIFETKLLGLLWEQRVTAVRN